MTQWRRVAPIRLINIVLTLLWFRPHDEPRDRISPLLLREQRFHETLTELRGMLERAAA